MAEQKDITRVGTEKAWLVRYRLANEKGRSPRFISVNAKTQADAKKVALATIPNAEIIGGAQTLKESDILIEEMMIIDLDEGVLNFVKGVGKFLARCVGRGCLAYARTPVRAGGTMSHMRKQLSREIAGAAGARLMRAGDGDYKPAPGARKTPKYKSFDPNIKEPTGKRKTYKLKSKPRKKK